MKNFNYIFLCILLFFKLATTKPFIFKQNLRSCFYNSSVVNGSALTFTSELWNIEDSDIILYYTLCGSLPESINCGPNVAACLKKKKYNYSTIIIGKKIVLENYVRGTNGKNLSVLSLKTVNGDVCDAATGKKYKTAIKFECNQDMKETRLEKKSDCDFVIHMIHPECMINCTTKVDNQLIDLRQLKGNYFVQSKGSNFSIALCGAKQQNCFRDNTDVSVCEKYDGGMMALSNIHSERIVYNEQKNEMMYRGVYKGVNGTKKFELLLNCDWENDLGQIKRKEVQVQGKEYKFVMDSSYGCVKLPPKCTIMDTTLIYNLTNLSSTYGYRVLNAPKGSSIYLNICGSLNFKEDSENSCSRSYSQVCELKDGKYINRGAILSNFEVLNDVIKITYTNGMKCKEDPLKHYNTHIDFFCSMTDLGPTFSETKDCDLYIIWHTPEACPIYNSSVCQYKEEYQDCSVTFQGQHYDLSPLKSNKNYEIVDPKNSTIRYFLNVCEPIIDPDVPCMKTSMIVMKDMNEKNAKYRTKSLGKMDQISIVNNQIVIMASFGTYCGGEGDYTSNVYFVCIKENEKESLRLLNKTECKFNFQWKTSHACLKTHSIVNQCIIKNPSNGVWLDFGKLKQTSLKITINDINYTFDFCKNDYTECSLNGQCEEIPLTKHLLSSNGTSFLELVLPKDCDAPDVINKVIFDLVCDRIMYNEHFKLERKVENCTVNLLFYTSLVCDEEEYETNSKNEYEKYDVSGTISDEEKPCFVTNYVNGYKINISSLHLNIPVDVCPMVLFYEHNTSVILMYPTEIVCNKSIEKAHYVYKAILQCSKQNIRDTKKMDCYELYHLESPEFCNLFEPSSLGVPPKNNAVIIVCSTIGVIVVLGLCIFFVYKWRIHFRRLSYLTVYDKDGDI